MEDQLNNSAQAPISNYTESLLLVSESDIPWYIVTILILIGTVGNVLVCLAIAMDKKLQTVTNYFLLSLAMDDLLINLVILPLRIWFFNYVLQPSADIWCFAFMLSDDYLTAASALHICAISLDRYFAIKNPVLHRPTRHRMTKMLVLVYLLSMLTVVPFLIVVLSSQSASGPFYCQNRIGSLSYFEVIIFMEAFIIFFMVAVVVCCFLQTSIILWKLDRQQKANQNGNGLTRTIGVVKSGARGASKQAQSQQYTERKALRIVWIVSFAFVIALGPYAVPNFLFISAPHVLIDPVILRICAYLVYTNSAINPILYSIFYKRFRCDFVKLLRFKCKQI